MLPAIINNEPTQIEVDMQGGAWLENLAGTLMIRIVGSNAEITQ